MQRRESLHRHRISDQLIVHSWRVSASPSFHPLKMQNPRVLPLSVQIVNQKAELSSGYSAMSLEVLERVCTRRRSEGPQGRYGEFDASS